MGWRVFGIIFVLVAALAVVGEVYGLRIPSVHVLFPHRDTGLHELGWVFVVCFFVLGGFAFIKSFFLPRRHPVTDQKMVRFKKSKLGAFSFTILGGLFFLSLLDGILVGRLPLAMLQDGVFAAPAFMEENKVAGEEVDYRELRDILKTDGKTGDWVILPLWPYSVNDDQIDPEKPPSTLGLAPGGKEVVAALFAGLQSNFLALAIYLPVVTLLGLLIGVVMGYFGGLLDFFLQRLIEILTYAPAFLLVLLLLAKFGDQAGNGVIFQVLLLSLVGWIPVAATMRKATQQEAKRTSISASLLMGASWWHVLTRHLLPNTIFSVVAVLPQACLTLVLSLTALDFLDFGISPDRVTWGSLLREGWEVGNSTLVAAVFVSLTIFSLLLVGIAEAVRESFTPIRTSSYR